jgi:general secretion pathway protein G
MAPRSHPCPQRARRRGFTLIELMVVMAIVALLLSVAAPRYFAHLERAREAALRQTLLVVRDAIDKFHGDTGRYPVVLDELVERRYLRKLPVDPISESSATWVVVPPPGEEPGGVWDLHSGAGGEEQPYARW